MEYLILRNINHSILSIIMILKLCFLGVLFLLERYIEAFMDEMIL